MTNLNVNEMTNKGNYGYYIVDTNNCYGGNIFLSVKDVDKLNELEWTYMASQSPNRWHGNKALAEVTVDQLRELRDLAGLPKELDWSVVYANYFEMKEKDPFKGINWVDAYCAGQTKFINLDVPRGFKGKHRQALKEICNKFKPIYNKVNQEWRKKEESVAV